MVIRSFVIAIVFGAVLGVQSPTAGLVPTTPAFLAHSLFAAAPCDLRATIRADDRWTAPPDDSSSTRRAGSNTRREDAVDGPACQTEWYFDQSGSPTIDDTTTKGAWEDP
jgi:hypothetical protein